MNTLTWLSFGHLVLNLSSIAASFVQKDPGTGGSKRALVSIQVLGSKLYLACNGGFDLFVGDIGQVQ